VCSSGEPAVEGDGGGGVRAGAGGGRAADDAGRRPGAVRCPFVPFRDGRGLLLLLLLLLGSEWSAVRAQKEALADGELRRQLQQREEQLMSRLRQAELDGLDQHREIARLRLQVRPSQQLANTHLT